MALKLDENDPTASPSAVVSKKRILPFDWAMLSWVSFAQMVSWGIIYYGFAVMMTPMGQDLGWTKAEMTGAFSLALALSGVAAIPVGFWLDKHGPRQLMIVGSILAVALVFAWAQVDTLAEFYLVWAALGFVMAAVLYEPAFFIVATWFSRQKGKALKLLTLFGGMASVIFVPLATYLVHWLGWRSALQVLAIILLVATVVPHLIWLRENPLVARQPEKPADPPREVKSLRGILSERTFWLMIAAFALATVASGAITVHLMPMLLERGYSPAFAASMMAAVGFMQLPGRLIFTPLGERYSRRLVTATIFLTMCLAFLALFAAPGLAGIVLFAVLFGAASGATTPARAAILAERYHLSGYGRISGVVVTLLTVARACAPVAGSLVYSASQGYATLLVALAGVSIIGAAIVYLER